MFGQMNDQTLAVKIRGDSSSLRSAAGKATASLSSLRTAALGVSAAVVGVGAAMAGKAIGAAADFNQSMADLKAAADATNEEMDLLEGKTKEVAKRSRFMASDIAKAQKALAKSGFTAKETTAAIDGVADAAAASGEPIEQVGIQLTNVVKGYGLAADETSRVADVFAEAARSSNTHISTLSKAMEHLGPVAKDMGLSIERTTAMLGKLGDAGISAGRAGRQLRTAFLDFQKMKTGDVTKPAKEALERLGVSIKDVQSDKYSFQELIERLSDAGATAGDMSTIFTKRAATAIQILAKQGGELGSLTRNLEKSQGAAQEMAETKLDTLKAQFDVLKGSVNLLFEELGQNLAPALKGVVKQTVKAVNTVTSLVDGSKSLNEVFGGVIQSFQKFKQALPPIIANNLKEIANSLKILGAAFAAYTLAPVIGSLATALGGLVTSVAPIAAAIIGITAALTAGQKIWNRFFGDLNPVISKFASVVGDIGISAIKETVQALKAGELKKIPQIWKTAFQGIAKAAKMIWPTVKKEISQGLQDMYSAFKNQFPELGKIIDEHLPGLKEAFSGIIEAGKGYVDAYKGIIKKFIGLFSGLMGGTEGSPINRLKIFKEMIKNILSKTLTVIEDELEQIKNLFQLGEAVLSGDWKTAIKELKDIAKTQLDIVKTAINSVVDNIIDILKLAGVWDEMKSAYKRVVDTLQKKLVEPLKSIPENMEDIGKNIIEGIWTGLKSHLTGWFPRMVENADIPGFLKGPLKKVLGIGSPAKTMVGPGRALVDGIGLGIVKELPSLMDKLDKVGRKTQEKVEETVQNAEDTITEVSYIRTKYPHQIGAAGPAVPIGGPIAPPTVQGNGPEAPGNAPTTESVAGWKKVVDNLRWSQQELAKQVGISKERFSEIANAANSVISSFAEIARSTGKLKPGEGAKISAMTGFASAALQGNWLQAGLSLITGFFKAQIEKMKAKAKELRNKIDAAFSILHRGISSFGSAINKLAGDILGPFSATLSGFTSSLGSFATMIREHKMGNTLEMVKAGFQGVMSIVDGLVSTFANLIKKSEGYKALQERLKPVWQTIGNALGKLLMPLAALVDWATKFLGIATGINEEAEKMEEIGIPQGFKRARQVYQAAAPGQPVTGGGGMAAIPEWARQIIQPLKQYLRPILVGVKEAGGIGKIITRWVKNIWKSFMPWLTQKIPAILDWIGKAINWLKNEVNWDAIWKGIKAVAKFFWQNFKPAWNAFTTNLSKLLGKLVGKNGLIGQLKTINKNLRAIARSMGVATKVLAGAAGGAAIGAALGGPIGAIIGGGIGAIGGFLFQEGGIATEPTLGMVAESGPEAVVPLDKADKYLGRNGETYVKVYLSDKDVTETVVKEVQTRNKEYTGSRSTGALQKRRVLT